MLREKRDFCFYRSNGVFFDRDELQCIERNLQVFTYLKLRFLNFLLSGLKIIEKIINKSLFFHNMLKQKNRKSMQ